MTHRLDCPDCEATMEFHDDRGWRCPWATATRRRTEWVEGQLVVACNAPYERTRMIDPPQPGRLSR